MEFEQTYSNGAADWSFPSPGATPTTSNFNQYAFHTPKTATYPSEFFHDAFSTPQMPGYATPQQPDYATMTPLQRHHMSTEVVTGNNHTQIHMSAGRGQGNDIQLPKQTGHQGPVLSPAWGTSQPSHAVSFDSSQMQTPPPTRRTSARKPTPQQIAFGTPSTIASRRFATPQQMMAAGSNAQGNLSDVAQFPQLQFSPNVYQFNNLGPASAPVFPQTQLLWDQTASPQMYGQQHMLDDPFAPAVSGGMQWPLHQNNMQTAAFNTPEMTSFPVQPPTQRPASAGPTTATQAHLSPPIMTMASVDPSLVYSSPIRPVLLSNSRQSNPRSTTAKPDVKRKDSVRTQHQRTDTLSSTESASFNPTQEQRRSNTTGTNRLQTAFSSSGTESLSRRNSMLQAPRTASPLKRVGKLPLGSISESKARPRTSVVLTVDETGRARTVTQTRDGSPTPSVRERYPGLFDSDSSDDGSEEEDQTPSRSASFSFARGEERNSKVARLDPPVENLVGLTIPRSSSSVSTTVTPSRAAIAAAAQLRRGGSLRKQTPSRNGQRRVASAATSSIDTCPMDISSERRQSSHGTRPLGEDHGMAGSALAAHNRRWSIMSQEQQSLSPQQQFFETSHQSVQPGRLVRCSCGDSTDYGQGLAQCHTCTQWSHMSCAGFTPASVPPSFTCFLCTKPTHGLRMSRSGNRNRS